MKCIHVTAKEFTTVISIEVRVTPERLAELKESEATAALQRAQEIEQRLWVKNLGEVPR